MFNELTIQLQKDAFKVLWGNKCDLTDEKVISSEEGMKKAEKYGAMFFETSTKDCLNISEVFDTLSKEVNESISEGRIKDEVKSLLIIKPSQNRDSTNNKCY